MKLLAPCVTKHLSDNMWICIASKADVAAPTEPVTQVFILRSSVCEALYLTCKNGLLAFLPKTWSYTDLEKSLQIKLVNIMLLLLKK